MVVRSTPKLIPKQEAAARRVEKWTAPLPMPGLPPVDTPAYRALVDTLVGSMIAVGPAEAAEGITALVKTLALMLASTLRLEDEARVSDLCVSMSAWIENEVMALRKVVPPTVKKGN